jgi:hypothetical protein
MCSVSKFEIGENLAENKGNRNRAEMAIAATPSGVFFNSKHWIDIWRVNLTL